MKKHTWQAAAFLLAFLAAAVAFAQNNPMVLKADIGFPFVVGNQVLPAGHYELSNLGESTIRIVDSHKQGAIVLSSRVDGAPPESYGKLVFHRCQNRYFLAQVWSASSSQGKQVYESAAEKELERKGVHEEIAVVRFEN